MKITLNDTGSLIDSTTASTNINANFTTIETAFDNTLSRDGTAPNTMQSTLDMNSNSIINLPAPIGSSSPLRLGDLTSPIGSGVLISPISNSLAAEVLLNNTSNYFDGPSIAQGTAGTWFVTGSVTILDTVSAASFVFKLWDGVTILSSGYCTTGGVSYGLVVSLSGFITSPVGNLRISCKGISTTTGKILANIAGNLKDSTITAFRIA